MSFYRSIVIGNLLANWRAKYGIPNLVEMIIPELSNLANTPTVGCVALNPTF